MTTATRPGIVFNQLEQFDPMGGDDFYLLVPIARPDGSYSAIALTNDGDTSICFTQGCDTPQQAIALLKEQMEDAEAELWDFLMPSPEEACIA